MSVAGTAVDFDLHRGRFPCGMDRDDVVDQAGAVNRGSPLNNCCDSATQLWCEF